MKRLLAALKDLLTAHQFHRSIRTLALPMALAAILSSSLQIVDTLMIARLGDDAVAAVGLANRLTYVLSFFTSGLASGAGIFTAQFNGRIRAGQEPVQGEARRIDFLNEWNPAGFRNAESGRTGNRQNGWPPAQKIADPAQQQGGLRGNLCAMPVVIAVNDVVLTV